MSRLSMNLIASFISRGWSALLSLAFVPVYIRFVGVEAYGLIGAFATLQAVLGLLDLGLGSTLTREFARSHDLPASAKRDLLRTLEGIFWAVALFIALSVWLFSGFIAQSWLHPESLSPAEIKSALAFAGLAFAFQWPTNLYVGGMYGLQRQGLLAAVMSSTATLRVAMTIAALAFISPSITCFFVAQACANLIQTVLLACVLWSRLPSSGVRASIRPASLRGILGFAGGMFGISVTTIVLTQLDKAILSNTLTLEAFGYYAIASTLAAGLYIFITPLFGVFFPRFSQLVRDQNDVEIERLYHMGNQLMAVIVVPVVAVASLFSAEILRFWSGSGQIAANSGLVFSLLIIGNALNGLMNIPFAVQLANGWTSLAFYSNVVAILVCAPLIYILSMRMGAIGGALGWVILTTGYFLISLQIMHRRIAAIGSSWRFYLQDIGGPAAAAFVVAICGRIVQYFPSTVFRAVVFLALVTALATIAACVCAPVLRGAVLQRVSAALPSFR
jgi:O-antigen/teichoic acid export membrane protein